MEISVASATVSIAIVVVSWWVWRTLKRVWFQPKKLESYLRRQGLSGSPYTLLVGDLKSIFSMLKEARSKPIKLTDDITPRLVPYPLKMLKTHGVHMFPGRTYFTWLGPIQTITIMDPELIKEVFNKVYDFQKPHTFPLFRLLGTGLANSDGDKWAKHRRIINPDFHLEKIKNMIPAFHQSCSEVVGEWDKLVSDKGLSCEVDVWPGLVSMTADVISRTAFGSSYKEGQRIFELQAELAQQVVLFRGARDNFSTSGLDNGSAKPIPRLAREEVKQVFGDKIPDIEGLNQLKVMTMILYGVLRLYPPVTHVTRAIHKEMKLGDLTLPGGVQISLPILLVQRDTHLWGNDAGEFKPERFKEGLSKATKSQVSFFPFAWGPRICIGQNFALLEAKMAMALILHRFSFDLSPSYVHAPYTVITIHPQFGAPLILNKLYSYNG